MSTFPGFAKPESNFFKMPNDWPDISAEITNLAELKIVEYVLRHTWGYQEYDILKQISVDEFMHGRKRTDGTRMDKGTRLSEQSVRNGLERAIAHGFLVCAVDDTDRARIKKSYALNMRKEEEAKTIEAKELDPQTLDPENGRGQNVRPQKRGPRTPKSLTSDSQNVDLGVPDSRPRTEKYTGERNAGKTPLKDTNHTHLSSSQNQFGGNSKPALNPPQNENHSQSRRKDPLATASLEIQALIAAWRPCHEAFYRNWQGDPKKAVFEVNQTLIDRATKLVGMGVEPAILPTLVEDVQRGWPSFHAREGLHLGSIVKWVEDHGVPHEPQKADGLDQLYYDLAVELGDYTRVDLPSGMNGWTNREFLEIVYGLLYPDEGEATASMRDSAMALMRGYLQLRAKGVA